jgi:Domain of unknown function (DUF5606)
MKLSDLASVSGKGGLFKVVAPTKTGVILESLDEQKAKLVGSANLRISLLHEISIYTTTKEGTVSLHSVLKKVNQEFANDLGVDADSDASELKSFLKSVLPEYDEDRVYVSDIKKLVKWYSTILKYAPEVFDEEDKKAEPRKEE